MTARTPRQMAVQFFDECYSGMELSSDQRESLIDCLTDMIHADRILSSRGWRSRIQSKMAELQQRLTKGQNLQDLITEIRQELEQP